jgi:hypothetical protein
MSIAKSKEEFEKAAQGLPFREPDLSAEVVCVEPIDGAYFRNTQRQRCIIRTKAGGLYVSNFD